MATTRKLERKMKRWKILRKSRKYSRRPRNKMTRQLEHEAYMIRRDRAAIGIGLVVLAITLIGFLIAAVIYTQFGGTI